MPFDTETGGSDIMSDAGWSSGDFVPAGPTAQHGGNFTTGSSSMVVYQAANLQPSFTHDDLFSGTVQMQAYLSAEVDPSSDQINIDLHNATDGEVVVSIANISGNVQRVDVGPTNYTPTTNAAPAAYNVRMSNDDNLTAVGINDVTVQFGYQL